jgi:hypothetical protein
MGQPIQILSTTVVGDVAMFSTDRGITGQSGDSLARGDDRGDGFPATLAGEVFALDDSIDHVTVASNQVVARRSGGWDDALLGRVASAITGFFVFYRGEGSETGPLQDADATAASE